MGSDPLVCYDGRMKGEGGPDSQSADPESNSTHESTDSGDLGPSRPSAPARDDGGETDTGGRRTGPLESLFQEAIRRAFSAGLGGFFLTEEAIRQAVTDTVPQEWVDYLSRQGDEVRSELTERLTREFGHWLRTLDPVELLRGILDDYEFSARIQASPKRSAQDAPASLKVVRRRE